MVLFACQDFNAGCINFATLISDDDVKNVCSSDMMRLGECVWVSVDVAFAGCATKSGAVPVIWQDISTW